VVLVDLRRHVAFGFEQVGESRVFGPDALLGARHADGRQTSAERELSSNECGATRSATRLTLMVSKQSAFIGDAIDVWRFPSHNAAMVGANIEPAHVVSHNQEYVWFLLVWHFPC